MAIEVRTPYQFFTDRNGAPLESGYVYIGGYGQNPLSAPASIYWDADNTITAAQPVRTQAGYPVRDGSAARIYTPSTYSITVTNRNGALVWSSLYCGRDDIATGGYPVTKSFTGDGVTSSFDMVGEFASSSLISLEIGGAIQSIDRYTAAVAADKSKTTITWLGHSGSSPTPFPLSADVVVSAGRDAAATASDAAATAADRVQTGLDAVATAADAVATASDAAATAADRVQTGEDRVQTGLDAVATAEDRVQTGEDAAATAADAVATAADRVQTGLDVAATSGIAVAISHKVTVFDTRGVIYVNTSSNTVTLPKIIVKTAGIGGVTVEAATVALTTLNTPRGYVYVDLAAGTPIYNLTTTAGLAELSATIVPILVMALSTVTPNYPLPVTYSADITTASLDTRMTTAEGNITAVDAETVYSLGVITPQTSNGAAVRLRTLNGVRQVGFPQMRVEREGHAGAVFGNASDLTWFNLETSPTLRKYYYGTISTGAISETATKATAYPTADIVRLGWSSSGVFANPHGFSLVDENASGNLTEIGQVGYEAAARVALTASDVPSAYFGSAALTLEDVGTFSYTTPYSLQNPYVTEMLVRVDDGKTVDLSYVRNGETISFAVPTTESAAKLYIDPATPFLGGFNEITIPAGGAATVKRIGGSQVKGFAVWPAYGTTLSTATVARHVYGESFALAGQSYSVQYHTNGGIGGFVAGLTDASWMGTNNQIDPDFYFIQGATGSSAVDQRSSATIYWWDALAGSGAGADGPCLTTFKAAVADAVSKGQPAPKYIRWEQGRGDNAAIEAGTFTVESLIDSIRKMMNSMETVCDPAVQWIFGLQGPEDRWDYSVGASAVRRAYLAVIEDRPNARLGGQVYDLMHGIEEPHATFKSNYALGYRDALIYGNAFGGRSNIQPPTLATATLTDDYTATLTFSSGNGLRMPVGDLTATTAKGPTPWLFGVVPAGSSTAIPVRGTVSGNSIVLSADTPLTTARIWYPYGSIMPEARGGNIVRDKTHHVDVVGLPLTPFSIDVLNPSRFLSGNAGFAIDASKYGKMYLTSAGATNVTAADDPVGNIKRSHGVYGRLIQTGTSTRPTVGTNCLSFNGTQWLTDETSDLINVYRNANKYFFATTFRLSAAATNFIMVVTNNTANPRFGVTTFANGALSFFTRADDAGGQIQSTSAAGLVTTGVTYALISQYDMTTGTLDAWLSTAVGSETKIMTVTGLATGVSSDTPSLRVRLGGSGQTGTPVNLFSGKIGTALFAPITMNTASDRTYLRQWMLRNPIA